MNTRALAVGAVSGTLFTVLAAAPPVWPAAAASVLLLAVAVLLVRGIAVFPPGSVKAALVAAAPFVAAPALLHAVGRMDRPGAIALSAAVWAVYGSAWWNLVEPVGHARRARRKPMAARARLRHTVAGDADDLDDGAPGNRPRIPAAQAP